MGFFSKKQEVNSEAFCSIFYKNVILNCEVGGQDVNALVYTMLKKALMSKDSKFADIDLQKLKYEYIIIEFELFSLAFLYQFGDKLAIAQSIFTKKYLHENNRDDIWNAMKQYHEAIARSSSIGKNPETASGRAAIGFQENMKFDLFSSYCDKGNDPECIARVIGKLFTEELWKTGAIAGFILFTLCDRLGFDPDYQPSEELHNQWRIEINDFFNKAKESMNKVKIK